ncbi:MAG: hypothetical protein JW741_24555 [Sedimentisphaerales bacterium]|nr:hypothetical protein [Sedimentisphaerales bacterium]
MNVQRIVVCLALVVLVGPRACAAEERSIFQDMQFRRGFLLSYPSSTRGRSVEAVLDLGQSDARPLWRLCQWATRYSLAGVPCVRGGDGDAWYENPGKKVLVGGANSANRDLVLEVRAGAEYGTRARRPGEGWPHLLVEQDAAVVYRLDELQAIAFEIGVRLLYCKSHMTEADYDPGLHAAQFQMFFIVKNVNPEAQDHGDFFWFGVPFHDNRHDVPPAFMAKDVGKSDATGKFIYTIAGKAAGVTSLADGRWLTAGADLLGHIKAGLREAVKRGYLNSADPRDYAVVNMNLGWEMPGTFDAAMQVRDLHIRAVLKDGTQPATSRARR